MSAGRAGPVRGGDRLPWVRLGEAQDNYAPLDSLGWQVHVYGTAPPQLHPWCREHRLPLHCFAWLQDMRRVGIARDAMYLVRPDGYVGFAAAPAGPEGLAAYWDAHAL